MTHYCRYHVLEPASWHCSNCLINFCSTCSPESESEEAIAAQKCPHCRGLLRPLSASHTAAPFWMRLTDFLRYPLSIPGLVLMLVALLIPLVVPAGIPLHVMRLLFLVVITKYLWTVFEQVADGNIEPIGPQPLLKMENNGLVFSLGAMLAAIAGGVMYVRGMNGFYGGLLIVFVIGLLPALLLAVGINRSVGSGFSKDGLVAVLTSIGLIYPAIFFLPVALLVALHAFVGLFADILPVAVGQALALTANTYFAIVLFVLSGYVLLQYQEVLGYAPEGKSKTKSYKKGDPVQLQVEMFLKDGNYSKAMSLLQRDADKQGATLSQHERYHRLIWAMGAGELLKKHAAPYFKTLLQAGRDMQVASLLRDYVQRYPDFRIEDPEVRLDMAQAIERVGDYKLAVHVLNGLHKDNPHFPALPTAYLMAARLLADQLGMPQKGLALVQFLHGRYRNHRSFPEIQKALADLTARVQGGQSA